MPGRADRPLDPGPRDALCSSVVTSSPREAAGRPDLMPGFRWYDVHTDPDDVRLRTAVSGSGPPLLLLHGYPQTHLTWHLVAPRLAERFTVVAPDLRGYGDSAKPGADDPGKDPTHATYAKRATAADLVGLMQVLGHERFAVVGHDRGGRVAHRMALDHPDVVDRLAVLDIAPTATMYARADAAFARAYYWWFLLIQDFPLPERLIGGDPDFYLDAQLAVQMKVATVAPEVHAEYHRAFRDPRTRHAMCEDYRAAASIDLEHDRSDAGTPVRAPLLALWGALGLVGSTYDVLATWREKATDVSGRSLPCGHCPQEEVPDALLEALLPFLGG